jgi:hypothetical protein
VRIPKPWGALAAVSLTAMTASPARAEPSPALPQDTPPKRPLPDYGVRRPEPKTARDIALWVPRLVLSPLYLVSEYVVRAPLSALIPALERAEAPRKLYDFFAFGSEHKAGIVPVGYADFGFNPSVGVYGFWNDAWAKGNDWSVHAEAWPDDWYAFSLKESVRLDGREGPARPGVRSAQAGPGLLRDRPRDPAVEPEPVHRGGGGRERHAGLEVLAREPLAAHGGPAQREPRSRPLRHRSEPTAGGGNRSLRRAVRIWRSVHR